MAYSASTGFRFRRSLYGGDLPAGLRFRVANSATIKIGDAVRVNNAGFLVRAAAGNPVLGILTGIVNNTGINVFGLGATTASATLTEDDQVATSSTNQTNNVATGWIEGEVVVDPAGALLWYNDADDTMAQTNVCQFYDVVAASAQIDESSADDSSGQFQCVVLDPDGDSDASKGLFRIAEPQLLSEVGNGGSGADVTVNAA
jgi:hypothetical protein